MALLSASRSAKPIGLSFGSVSHWPAAAVIAAIAFAAVHAGRRHPGRLRAMLTGAGAGLVFGIQDALTRQTLEILSSNGVGAMFTTWAPYALVGAGATGIWLMQSAFNAGPLQLSLPAISAGEPLVGILLGVLVFGDRIQITPGGAGAAGRRHLRAHRRRDPGRPGSGAVPAAQADPAQPAAHSEQPARCLPGIHGTGRAGARAEPEAASAAGDARLNGHGPAGARPAPRATGRWTRPAGRP